MDRKGLEGYELNSGKLNQPTVNSMGMGKVGQRVFFHAA